MAHPEAEANAASIAIVEQGRVLLIKRAFAPYQGLWTLPGGRREPSETPSQTAIREVAEELGLTVANPRHVLTQALESARGSWRLAVYVTADHAGTIAPSSEVAGHAWVEPAAISAMRTTAGLSDVIEKAFAVLAGR